jgi:peptide/nickel transport system substrate-binding protein
LVAVLGAVALAYWIATREGDGPKPATGTRGGRLIATNRSEPKSLNRYVAANLAAELVSRLTQDTLVRLNLSTGELEPRLASEWTTSEDGRTWTLTLRDGLLFSDGTPFTAADVVFSFEVLYDPRVKSPIASSVMIAGQPLTVRALDARRIIVTFPSAYGPGLTLLDAVPILPQHKLRGVFDAGKFRDAWGVTTAPAELAGLGPFVLREYVTGQRLLFARNPHFWRRDEQGEALPYLDEIEVQIVPEQNAEILRLEAGEVDLITDQVRPEDLAALQKLQDQGAITLNEAGIALNPEMLWFNLDPASPRARTRPWLQRPELRRAISHAVDRQRIVHTVYLGAAEPVFGPVTPGHGEWYLPDLPRTDFDPARAKVLLQSIGLIDRNGDGKVDDERGETARFSILTTKGHTIRERSAAIIQEQLAAIGLTAEIVAIDGTALVGQLMSGDGNYDAILFSVAFDSFDPASYGDFWTSSGSFHFWHPGQVKPATEWEAQIDDLMLKQTTSLDRAERRRLFGDVQRIFAANLPVLYFAAPKVVVATSARVGGALPSVLSPTILWNAEMLSLVPAPAGSTRK